MFVGFLHTAESNVALFEAAMRDAAPDAHSVHLVRPELLEAAVAGRTAALEAATGAAVADLAASGCGAVVVTCTSLGGIADDLAAEVPVVRVDRPLARAAVRAGATIGVVTAAPTSVAPTLALLIEEADAAGTHPDFLHAHLPDAWQRFAAGGTEDYLALVAAELRDLADRVDAVVLAQASMAPAAAIDLGVPVLTSPMPSVAAALALAAGTGC